MRAGVVVGLIALVGCWDEPGQHVGTQDCVACHLDDYQTTTNPPHVDAFPQTCGDCHSTDAWIPAVGGHPEPAFPIAAGAHADILCADCHDVGRGPNGAENTLCVGCHSGDHDRGPMDDLHAMRAVAGYPTGPQEPNFCLVCHPDGTADQARHPEMAFPIAMGAHVDIICNECHDTTRGPNGPENTDCVGCHTNDHDRATTDAFHVMRAVAGYPTGDAEPNFCLVCHPDGTAAAIAHPDAAFPISMGVHMGVTCNDCHKASRGPNGAGNTDCVNCHSGEHLRAEMDPLHSGVGGYPTGPAEPNFCLTCHPDGTADSLPHPEPDFPIANGAHSGYECAQCHKSDLGSNLDGMNADCVGCHEGEHRRSVLDPKHREVDGYPSGAAPPNFCLECHPNGRN